MWERRLDRASLTYAGSWSRRTCRRYARRGWCRGGVRCPASRSRSDAVSRVVAGLVDHSRRRQASPIMQDRFSSATKDGRSGVGVIDNESKE